MSEEFLKVSVHMFEKPAPGGYLLVGVPDVGLVGEIATSYIVRKLELKEIGLLDSYAIPPVAPVMEGKVKHPARIYHGKVNGTPITAVLIEVAIPVVLFPVLGKKIVELAQSLNARILMMSGIPIPNRLDIEKPQVFGVGVRKEDLEDLKKAKIEVVKEGFVAGVYASILREAIKADASALMLLAESYPQYPDPGAAASAIERLEPLCGIKVDVADLIKDAEKIRMKLKQLMEQTLREMPSREKKYEYASPIMYA